MSLTGLPYDNCAYTHKLNESVGAGDYLLNTPRPCNPCFVVSPGVFVDRFGASLCEKELIDVNSELLNITRKASECPSQKYLPKAEPFCNPTHYKECEFLTREDTLISNPKCTGKETTVNRWEWLCRNPQDYAIRPFEWFTPNRIVVKDSHRPCVAKPIAQDNALPPKQQNNCPSTLEEQFKEGDWVKNIPKQVAPPVGSLYAVSCDNVRRL